MDRKKVICKIVERDIRYLSLSATDIQAKSPALYKAACKHFGDWPTALLYAGVSPRREGDEYDNKKAVARRLRARCVGKQSVHATTVQRTEKKLYEAALKHFGTWRAALVAAGINVDNVRSRLRRPRYTREQILENLKGRHAQNLPMSRAEVSLDNLALSRAALSQFQSWEKALAAAGIESQAEVKKEYHIFVINKIRQLFLSRPGEIITREEILTACGSRSFDRRFRELKAKEMNIKFIKSDNGFIFYPDDGKEDC